MLPLPPSVSSSSHNQNEAKLRALSWPDRPVLHEVVDLASDLIRIPSLPGEEQRVTSYLEHFFLGLGWSVEKINIPGTDRQNLFVSFGTPEIIFTTHCDIVPGPKKLFTPEIKGNKLYGRGACDVKGALSAMIAASYNLRLSGKSDFGILVVVGEEHDGIGARISGRVLKDRGIRYIINAEPTEGKLATGHTGVVAVELQFAGRACHSGYPELGVDANEKMLRTAIALMDGDYGSDPELGTPVRTIGKISGGTVANQISNTASLVFSVRTVHGDIDGVVDTIRRIANEAQAMQVIRKMPPCKMISVPGFESCIVRYGTDIPHLLEGLNAEAVLFGPGSIHFAHTNEEHVDITDLTASVSSYAQILLKLSYSQHRNTGLECGGKLNQKQN